MPAVKRITLTEKEREQLAGMLRKGRWTPRQLKRAQILMLAHMQKELSNERIAQRLLCSRETVRRVRLRFLSHGLKKAFSEDARPGQPRKLGANDVQLLLSITADPKPIGYTTWTLPLLQKRLYKQTSRMVSTETIRRLLLPYKNGASVQKGK